MRARGIAVLIGVVVLLVVVIAPASEAQDSITVPTTAGQTVTLSWQGTVLPGANPTSDCTSAATVAPDVHEVNLTVPAGTYDNVAVLATATIAFTGNSDLILSIALPDGSSSSSDSGSFGGGESVSVSDPPPGVMRIMACAFAAAAPQAYQGTLTLTAAPLPAPAASCSRPGKPLQFTQPSYVDMHRAGGEPSVVAHPDGTLLYAAHAGTTHFYSLEADDPTTTAFFENYRGQVHAWYSTDHGASWSFVNRILPPDNAPGTGFSDPDFAIDAAGNVYLSEINLANVAVSKSTTSGRSYVLQNFFAEDITDRQWSAAGPANVLFIVGNPAGEGGTVPTEPVGNTEHTIYRSTDGGRTFSAGEADGGGLGDIVFDQRAATLYEAHYAGGALQVAAFRKALDPVASVALTPELNTVATGVSMLSHWPAIDVDVAGNVYVAWDESGNGARDAGVWYSYSTDGARTWASPARVNGDDHTAIWPWIAVGDPGKVAVAWFGNDHALPGNDAERATAADPWNVYVAQTQTGLGCHGSRQPGFRTTRATPQPFHVGTICMGGTTCQATATDRRLGDYFTIDIDTTGALVAAYSDTRQGGAVALPAFLRQTGGPMFAKVKKSH